MEFGELGIDPRLRVTISGDVSPDSSRGFWRVRKGAKTVRFIHESVNDFFLRNQRLQTLDSALKLHPIGTSHGRLSACCVTYLMIEGFTTAQRTRQKHRIVVSSYPFLEYAIEAYVFRTCRCTSKRCQARRDFVQQLEESDAMFERVRLFHYSFEENASLGCDAEHLRDLLYVSSLRGHTGSLLRSFWNVEPNVDAQEARSVRQRTAGSFVERRKESWECC